MRREFLQGGSVIVAIPGLVDLKMTLKY
jgi:hypothetical protein